VPLNESAARSIRQGVPRYRRLTPEQRADHVETLIMLGRMVVAMPTRHRVMRAFVVMTVLVN
jgi:hypothetical protein